MPRIALIALFTAAAFAQNSTNPFDRPPEKVDKALRERIDQFYEYHITRDYRKAEPLVAEDTKNFFYSRNKPAYIKCRIGRIEYSENYTRAKATELCEQYVMIPGFADKPLMVPIPSTWKIVKGKWYWYVDQESLVNTPFGKMKPGPVTGNSPLPTSIPTDPAPFLNLVKADKQSVALKPGQSGQVSITNTAAGVMTLAIETPLPGVEAKLDQAELKIGGRAVLTLRAERAATGVVTLKVQQTGETIPITVEVK